MSNYLHQKISDFLATFNRSPNTIIAYGSALKKFVGVVGANAPLNTDTYIKFLLSIKNYSPSSQQIFKTAVLKLYQFMEAGNWAQLKNATDHYMHRQGKRIVNFDEAAVRKTIEYCLQLKGNILNLRDKAFVLSLADTGLRISEACKLRRGDINWQTGRAIIIGKGDKQAVVRFSERAISALKHYLSVRTRIYGESIGALADQPLFARHDMSASKKIKMVGDDGMRKAIKERMIEAGVDKSIVRLHDFRHYFVTMAYRQKKDLVLAQKLARHESQSTTSRYAHLGGNEDDIYDEIFNKKKGE